MLIAAILYGLAVRPTAYPIILATFCALQCAPQLILLWHAVQRSPAVEPVESTVEI